MVAAAFAGIVTVALPLPVPLEGDTLRPDAVHGQDAPEELMEIEAVPPLATVEKLVGEIANEQVCPNSDTVYVWPPTVMVPFSAAMPVLAGTV